MLGVRVSPILLPPTAHASEQRVGQHVLNGMPTA